MSAKRFFAWQPNGPSNSTFNLREQIDSCPCVGQEQRDEYMDWDAIRQEIIENKEEKEKTHVEKMDFKDDVFFRALSAHDQSQYLIHVERYGSAAMPVEDFHEQLRLEERQKCMESVKRGKKLNKNEKRIWREMKRRGEVGNNIVTFEKPPKFVS